MTLFFLMDYNIYFDTAALFVILFLSIIIIAKKLYKIPSSMAYIFLMVITIITTIFDILAAVGVEHHKLLPDFLTYGVVYSAITLYFIFKLLISLAFLMYILVITESALYIFSKRRLLIAVISPYLIALIIIIGSSINGMMYSLDVVDDTFKFVKGPLYFVYPTVISLYAAYGFGLLIRYRILFKRSQLITFIALIHFNILAMIIQMIFPNYLVELFIFAISLFLLLTTIEAPADLIDVKTGVASSAKFINMVKKSYLLSTDKSIILLKISNFDGIYNTIDYDTANKYVYSVAQNLSKRFKAVDQYSSYYLDDGLFAFEFINNTNTELIAKDMTDYLLNLDEYDFSLSPFICICNIPNDFIDYNEFIKFTNNFHNKLDFMERIVIYEQIKDNINFIIQSNIDVIIKTAFEENELEIYYQPIYDIKNDAFFTAEALIRLNTKNYGFIEPNVFIPLAEKNGMIFEIDEFVLNNVFKFLASEEFKNLGLKYIEVNLSMLECVDEGCVNRIKSLIDKYHVNPDNLNIEVTESINVNDLSKLIDNINKLKELGINFSLDDYGTGYSNIERFSKLPIEIVKLDKKLVDLSETKNVSMVLENIISLNGDLNRQTVVEGVETKEQMLRFKDLKCDYIQGFYYSEALSLADFIKFIKNNNRNKEDNKIIH